MTRRLLASRIEPVPLKRLDRAEKMSTDVMEGLQRIVRALGYTTPVDQFLVWFGLGMARLVTVFSVSPVLGGNVVPARIRVGLAVIMTALLFPAISSGQTQTMQPLLFVALLAKEVFIGLTIGFFSLIVFSAAESAGQVIDNQRGMNVAYYYSPQVGGQTSLLGNLQFQVAVVLFLSLDGHLLFIRTLFFSFEQMPAGRFPTFPTGTGPAVESVIRVSADLLVIALQLSAPILLVLFLVDLGFMLLAKIAPQINIFQESLPVKALIGLMVLFFTAGFILNQFSVRLAEMLRRVAEIAGVLG